MTSFEHSPRVNVAKELSEISKDFTHPRELIRETISNSLDASASNISVAATTDDSSGEEELLIRIIDDGVGMTSDGIRNFFDLGYSEKRGADGKEYIGEKGHGTKIAYNSSRIRVLTKPLEDPSQVWEAVMDAPLRSLNRAVAGKGDPPVVKVTLKNTCDAEELSKFESGTIIEVFGYDKNNMGAFAHGPLVDYIQWSTAWGRVDVLTGGKPNPVCRLKVRGLGDSSFSEVPFGHPFPEEISNFKELKKNKDSRRPENFFVKRFISDDLLVEGYPTQTIKIFFSIEGDSAKRAHNLMLKRRGPKGSYKYREYRYSVQDRYGIYLCKDFIPIERKNEKFSSTSIWTKWHAFINCQGFHLTANRSSVDNTPAPLLEAIYSTAKKYIDEKIFSSDEYEDFTTRLEIERGRRKAEKEKRELRKRTALSKKKTRYLIEHEEKRLDFLEPRNEQEVLWLLARVELLWPEKFAWDRVLDHDARFGYDILVERTSNATGKTENSFVELKHTLRDSGDFNHSFATLWMIVCWDNLLTSADTGLVDIEKKKRSFVVTDKDETRPYTRHHLESASGGHQIDVVVLKRYLIEVLGMQTAS